MTHNRPHEILFGSLHIKVAYQFYNHENPFLIFAAEEIISDTLYLKQLTLNVILHTV